MRIAADVMGGDGGCAVIIDGLLQALEHHDHIRTMYLVGADAPVDEACLLCAGEAETTAALCVRTAAILTQQVYWLLLESLSFSFTSFERTVNL